MAGSFYAPYTGIDYYLSQFWTGWKQWAFLRYNAAQAVNNYTTAGIIADTDYYTNSGGSQITPQNYIDQDFAYIASNNIAGLVRLWVSVDSLMTTQVTATTATDATLITQAKANVLDMIAKAQKHGLRVILVLFVPDVNGPHSFFPNAITGAGSAWSGAGTSALNAAGQTYLTAMKNTIAFLDADPIANATVQYIDLLNEGFFQLSNNASSANFGGYGVSSANQSTADIQGWVNFLFQAAKQQSESFLYTVSQASSWSDSNNNLLALTPANQQNAINMYSGCDIYDIHCYYSFPPSYTFPVGVKGNGGAGSQLANPTLPSGKTVIDFLQQAANLPRPWYAGEVGGTTINGSSYNGYGNPDMKSNTWWINHLLNYGCQTVCMESDSTMTDRSIAAGTITYSPHPVTAAWTAATQAMRAQKMLRT